MKIIRQEGNNLYREAFNRLNMLRKMEKMLEDELLSAPEGSVRIVRRGKYVQYYYRGVPSDKNGTYIPKKEQKLIKRLVQKAYDQRVISVVKEEIAAINSLLARGVDFSEEIRNVYIGYQNGMKYPIVPLDIPNDVLVDSWKQETYVPKTVSESLPYYLTENGERVRSKSELNIANELFRRGIPYKYEKPLSLKNGDIIYPDFTILDVINRRQVYWEHRGMMDDRDYAKHSVTRVKDYLRNNIFLGWNLVITEETSVNPLGTDEIRKIIDFYFQTPGVENYI